ncbi:16S rRNA (adenine(1518)-N(6)/adenine(1519)-N(6))-dimethyltransferase RsmA [Lyticum sinuosum]|uniref:Ribosomal RNA small subunit methyltransferase A n=1 Tax=Lyticum sinuosum TaxID=1332059 RepID=A0AAE5AGY7_9RICK|nr:16S rRNA (adenine(1518)-N(6)/adenine(1519)-N(6))-dimethyltransferase RsmA [Lyticum sinuosum]MDZ5760950.1 Ribosomal RNA small subunit methyltransferase A [Lyticum sinuosum]
MKFLKTKETSNNNYKNKKYKIPLKPSISLNPTIKNLLRLGNNKIDHINIYANKSLGQHFLLDNNIVNEIVINILNNNVKSSDEISNIIAKNNKIILESNVQDNVSNVQDNVLKVQDNVSNVQDKVSKVQDNVSKVQDKVSNVQDKVSNVQDKVSNVQDKVPEIESNKEYEDVFVEIGPGLGILTESIARIIRPKNFIIIEQDSRFSEHISNILSNYPEVKAKIIIDDALIINEEEILKDILIENCNDNIDIKKNIKKIRLVSNLPYNISTLLIFKWLKKIHLFSDITIMLQQEVAMRLLAKPKTSQYGWISIIVQLICDVEMVIKEIKPDVFWPSPKVKSSVIRLKPKFHINNEDCENKYTELLYEKWIYYDPFSEKDWIDLLKFCKPLFYQRRKILKNTLMQINPDINWEKIAADINISLNYRPEEISPEKWLLFSRIASLHYII